MQLLILEIVCIAKKISSKMKKASSRGAMSNSAGNPRVAISKSFHFAISTAFSAGTTHDILSLTGGTAGTTLGEECVAFAQLSDLYRFWRPTRLRCRFYQTTFTAVAEGGGFLAACFVANDTTAPTTLGQLDGLPFSITQRPSPGTQASATELAGQHIPPLELDVPLANLQSLGGWFVTNGDSTEDTAFDGPGLIRLISTITNSSSIVAEFWISCDFASALDPTMIAPAERQRLVNKLIADVPVVSGKATSALVRLEDVVDLLQHPDEAK